MRRAVELQRLRNEHRYLLSERDEEFNHYGIAGRSRAMQEVISTLERVAETRSTVLVTGETGTGKELVARAIHDRSGRKKRQLVKVDCGAISAGLGYTLQVASQRYAPPADTAVILSLEAVFAALSGWLVLGEVLEPVQLLGCGIMFGGMLLSQAHLFRR